MVNLLIAIVLTIFLYQTNQGNLNQDIRSKAEGGGPTCDQMCVEEPPCCAEMIKQMQEKGDITDLPDSEQPYHACPNLYSENHDEGYCRPETCDQLPYGVKYRGRCGWYWVFHDAGSGDLGTNTPKGYGCMIGNSEATMRPICAGGPTAVPTAIPTVPVLPTQIVVIPINTPVPSAVQPTMMSPTYTPSPTGIRILPTFISYPTKMPIVIPTAPPSPTSSSNPIFTPTPVSSPFWVSNILPPREKIESFWGAVKTTLLDFFSKILP